MPPPLSDRSRRGTARAAVVPVLSALLWLAALHPDPVAAAPKGYRLAGLLAVGDGYIGLLALPDGRQTLVRRGSTVNGGRVERFTYRSVQIVFPSGTVELALEDSGARAASRLAAPATGRARRQPIRLVSGEPPPGFLESTADVFEALAAARIVDSARGADAQRALAERIAPLLALPPGARIAEVNERPVVAAGDALHTIADSLSNGTTARLSVATAAGMQRIYISRPLPP